MLSAPHRLRISTRLLYCATFGAVLGIYLLVLTVNRGISYHALLAATTNTVPDALLGIFVLRACRRWPGSRLGAFFVTRALLVTALATLSAAIKAGLGGIHTWAFLPATTVHSIDYSVTGSQLFLSLVTFALLCSASLVSAARDELQTQRALALEAELAALRAQLNPHFLFNTLHSVMALVRRDAGAAENALQDFGDLMRYVLRLQRDSVDRVSLGQELEFTENYLALESLRLGERLRVHMQIDKDALACEVPPLCLQPLLENAVQHAIAPRPEGGNVWVSAAVSDRALRLEVRDDGSGSRQQQLPEESAASNRQGLALIERRLHALYGNAAGMVRQAHNGDGFCVAIHLPTEPAE